jgi:transposase
MVAVSWATIHPEEAGPTSQQISVLGIDIAKLVFHVVGMDDTGHVVLRKRIARGELLPFIAKLSPLRIGMEACGSAHYWARRFREHGHAVRLMRHNSSKPMSSRRSTMPVMPKPSVKP